MRNSFGGNCYRCGLWVAPETGYFENISPKDRVPGGPKWRVQHCYRTHNEGVTCEMAKATAAVAIAHTEESQ